MAQVATAEVLLKLNRRDYDRELGQVQRQFNSLSRESFGININNRDADLALQTTLGIAGQLSGVLKGIGQASVNEFRAFSGALQGTAAISGASQEELEALKEEAIALGIATTKSPTQVAQAATAYTRLGFSASEATKDLGGLVQLSESTGSSLETSAQVTATATKIFGDSVSAIEAANIITASTTNTAVGSVDEFNQVLSKAAGLAKANKVPFDELASVFGLLRDSGSSAEVAGTAVRNVLQRLLVPGDKAKAAIKELGLQVRDQSGQFVGFRNVIDQLRASTAGLSDEARDTKLSEIFGGRASSAITSLLALDDSRINEVFDAIANSSEGAGVAAETADARLQGLNKTLTLLEGTTQTTKAAVGESLAPAFNIAAKATLDVLNTFLGLPKPIQNVVVGLGAATAATSSLVIGLSALRSAQASETFARLGLSVGALKETLMAAGEGVGSFSRGVAGAIGSATVEAPKIPSLTAGGAQARERLAIARQASAAQALSINERIAKETEFFAFKKDLAAKEAALSARRIATEQGGDSIAAKRAATEALKAKATANAAKVDAVAAKAAVAKSAADLKAAQSAQVAAAAEIKQSISTKASTVATGLNAAATKAAAFAKDVLAVATGKASAATASSAVATGAAVLQFALFAAAAFSVVEALKTFGIVANDSKKALNEFNDALKESGIETVESGEKQLGILDRLRVGFAELANNPFLTGGLNPAAASEDVTTAAREQARAILAAEEANKSLYQVVDDGNETFRRFGISLADEATLTSKTADEKEKLKEVFTAEIEEREKSIAAAQAAIAADANLANQLNPSIALLEQQISQREKSIAVLNGETSAKAAAEEATKEQVKSIKELQAAQDEANQAAELSLANAKAAATEQFAAGDISEAEQQKQIAEAESAALEERLKNNRAFLGELRTLQSGEVSDEQAQQLQADITAAEKEQAGIRLEIARNQIAEEKRISDERLQLLSEADQERVSQAEQAALEVQKILLDEQLQGVANAEQTQQRISEAELNGLQTRLANRKKTLSELQGSEGIDPEKQAEAEEKAQRDILQLEIDIAQKRLQIREREKQEQIKAIQEAQTEATRALTQGSKEQELALKTSLASQQITREEFEQQSTAGQKEATEQRIKLLQDEADAVRRLVSEGILPQEEAQKRLGEIQGQITDQQIKLVDQQIEVQKQLAEAVEERLQSEVESRKVIAQLTEQDLEFQKQAIAFQSELGGARQELADAQTALTLQRLGFAKEDAVTQQQAFELSKQIFEVEKAATLNKLENEKRVLDIKIQQQQLDNQIASSQANIAVLEAKAAVEAAKARNASQEELDNLTKVLQLKQNIVGQTEANAASQAELFQIQRDTLAVNEELTREQLAREEQQLGLGALGIDPLSREDQRELEREDLEASRIIEGLQGRTFADGGDQAAAIAEAALSNLDNESLFRDFDRAGGFASEIANLVSEFQGTGLEDKALDSVSEKFDDAESSFEVLEILRELVEVTRENSGSLTINADSTGDAVELLREARRNG